LLYGQSVKEQPRDLSVAADGADLAAAAAGDAEAFRRLTDPYTRELHLHCYRMLGSVHDAEDAMQETWLRVWRHLATFEGRGSLRAWLYRIATNVCLRQRPRRRTDPSSLPRALAEAVARGAEPAISLSPYPDAWLDRLEAPSGDPAADYDLRESVQLAFLAAVQLLPPRQRAALILRDVLGWSAGEVADALDATTASVNSALSRARATLAQQRAAGLLQTGRVVSTDEVARSLARRYVEAWQAVDIDALAAFGNAAVPDVRTTLGPMAVAVMPNAASSVAKPRMKQPVSPPLFRTDRRQGRIVRIATRSRAIKGRRVRLVQWHGVEAQPRHQVGVGHEGHAEGHQVGRAVRQRGRRPFLVVAAVGDDGALE